MRIEQLLDLYCIDSGVITSLNSLRKNLKNEIAIEFKFQNDKEKSFQSNFFYFTNLIMDLLLDKIYIYPSTKEILFSSVPKFNITKDIVIFPKENEQISLLISFQNHEKKIKTTISQNNYCQSLHDNKDFLKDVFSQDKCIHGSLKISTPENLYEFSTMDISKQNVSRLLMKIHGFIPKNQKTTNEEIISKLLSTLNNKNKDLLKNFIDTKNISFLHKILEDGQAK